jgi:peptide/nickel transport system substrate-binding protein
MGLLKIGRAGILGLAMLSILMLPACDGTPEQQPLAPDLSHTVTGPSLKRISIGITNPPLRFNPLDFTDTTSSTITSLLFPPLVDLDDSLQFVPMLADSIETEDNRTFVVKLNSKAMWTDGKQVTAQDLIYTVQLLSDPQIISSLSTNLSIIQGFDDRGKRPGGTGEMEGVRKVDDHTVEFVAKTKIDMSLFKDRIGRSLKTIPKHVLQNVDPQTLEQLPFFQNPNVSSGAFKFVTYEKDKAIKLTANKSYFKGAPKIDELIFKLMPASNIVAQLQSGDIQMNFPGIGTIAVEDFDKVKNMLNVRTLPGKSVYYQMMAFNMTTIVDIKVRQAIVYALNRDMMVNNLLRGEGEIVDTPYTSVHPYFNESLKPYPYDPAKARQLLREAGWDSERTLNLIIPSGLKTRERTAELIVENLKDVGIKAQVSKYDISIVSQMARKQDFDLLIVGYPFSLDPDVSFFFQSGVVSNISAYRNSQMDTLLQQGLQEMEPAKRRLIYNQVQELLVHDLPQITLYSDRRLKAVSKKVKVGEPKDIGTLINVQEWDIDN